jgi:hypothetical protein
MIYELRIYHCLAGRLPALVERFNTLTCRLFEKHGIKQVGFWTAEDESTSDLVYMLKWNSVAESEKRWASFRVDPEWIEARSNQTETERMIASITTQFLTPTAFSALR